jgi:hypothetical protein
MSPSVYRIPARRACAAAAVALVIAGLSGCAVINKVSHISHDVQRNRAIVNGFTQGLKNAKATPFEATYVTTGNSPVTVTYAVRPPHDISFQETGRGSGNSDIDLINNSSGGYSCTKASGASQWQCRGLGKTKAVAQNALVGIYTPSHWVGFLSGFSVVAGLAGDKVSTSSMSVNGFSLSCLDFVAKGTKGTSKICTTSQNILGYVKVASQPTSFEIKSYTASPAASAFEVPAGAQIVKQGG